jgi:hypothetical protein
MKDIKEEIERIKKLFTEERLYGNLINEQGNPDNITVDGKIDAAELNASSDDVIDSVEAAAFLRDNKYYVEKKSNSNQGSIGAVCFQSTDMKKIQKYVRAKVGVNYNNFNPSISSDSGVCYLRLKSSTPNDESPNGKISKVAFWGNGMLTFYYLLPKPVDFTSVDTLTGLTSGTMPNLSHTSPVITTLNLFSNMMSTNKIALIRYQCDYDPNTLTSSPTYSNLKFAGFYDLSYKRTAKPIEKKLIEQWLYNCCDGSGVPGLKSDADINLTTTSTEYLGLSSPGNIDDIMTKLT